MMPGSEKRYDPGKITRICLVYLIYTLLFYLYPAIQIISNLGFLGITLVCFGDRSAFLLFLLKAMLEPVQRFGVWGFGDWCCLLLFYATIAVLVAFLPVCIWTLVRKRPLPMMIFSVVSNLLSIAVLILFFCGLDYPSDLNNLLICGICVLHMAANGFLSWKLYVQYRAERCHTPHDL